MLNTNMPTHAARHLALTLPAMALVGLIAACNVGTSATPQPTGQPTSPPATAGPTPSPTPIPSPTLNPDLIQHPTGATDIVLRMETGGGFVPMGFFVTQAPTFTLYGDGTVIFQQVDTRVDAFNKPFLPWLKGHLDEDGIQALLQFALSTGRLANAREQYDQDMIADAPTTVFNLNAGGVEKVVSIYALSELNEPGPDAADRAGFAQLAEVLRTFQNQEELGEVTEYEPEYYRVLLLEAFGEPVGAVEEWPWDDLDLGDFPAGDEPGGIAILDAEHVAELLDVPNGGHPGIWINSPDGESLVQLGVRPLLPDENPQG